MERNMNRIRKTSLWRLAVYKGLIENDYQPHGPKFHIQVGGLGLGSGIFGWGFWFWSILGAC